jgi:hypothetical protein
MWAVLTTIFFAIVGAIVAARRHGAKSGARLLIGIVAGAFSGFLPLFLVKISSAVHINPPPSYFGRFRLYFEALAEGDMVIWTATGLFLVLALIIGAVWVKTAREFRREEERKRRHRRSEPRPSKL